MRALDAQTRADLDALRERDGGEREVVAEWTRSSPAVSYSTIQFSWGGLFGSRDGVEGIYALIHLAPDLGSGGCGKILCGIDRMDAAAPGWSWRGGLSAMPGETRTGCPACAELRDPSLVVVGVDARSFAAPWAEHGSKDDPVWARAS